MIIENAKWFINPIDGKTKIAIMCKIDGQEVSVPINSANRHYKEIMKQVEEGTLKIKDAD